MAQSPDEVADNPAEIRSQIEQTRAGMSETIDAIQNRLSPSRVMADAKESVTTATVDTVKRLADQADGTRTLVLDTIRENPLPSALAAVAAAALMIRALRKPLRDVDTYASGEWWLEPQPPAPPRRSYVQRHPLVTAIGLGAAGCAIWLARQSAMPAVEPVPVVDRYQELP
jgi:hypothetical protein